MERLYPAVTFLPVSYWDRSNRFLCFPNNYHLLTIRKDMNRRSVLVTGGMSLIAFAGCSVKTPEESEGEDPDTDDAATELERGEGKEPFKVEECPDPDLENEGEYEHLELEWILGDAGTEGVALVTHEEDIEQLYEESLDTDEADEFVGNQDKAEEFVNETDLDEQAIIAFQVDASSEDSWPQVIGIERLNDTVHMYTCIAELGEVDDLVPFALLIRIEHDGEPPGTARVTHWRGGEQTEFSSDEEPT